MSAASEGQDDEDDADGGGNGGRGRGDGWYEIRETVVQKYAVWVCSRQKMVERS